MTTSNDTQAALGKIIDLTLLDAQNALNHTQLLQATWQNDKGQIPVFIKQLTTGYQAVQRQQLQREATVLADCQPLALQPQIPQKIGVPALLAHSFEPNHLIRFDSINPYIIIRFYQGHTLKDGIRQNTLNLTHKVSLAIQLCQLIQQFHSFGYLHADIKPANVLITRTHQMLLLDFALAQTIDNKCPKHTNATCGTPAYMSPEQLTGQSLTVLSDYYSLGVTLYELFCGRPPFSANTLQGYALAHCQQPVPPLNLPNNLDYSAAAKITLNRLLCKLLAKLPQNRFDSLDEVINRLRLL